MADPIGHFVLSMSDGESRYPLLHVDAMYVSWLNRHVMSDPRRVPRAIWTMLERNSGGTVRLPSTAAYYGPSARLFIVNDDDPHWGLHDVEASPHGAPSTTYILVCDASTSAGPHACDVGTIHDALVHFAVSSGNGSRFASILTDWPPKANLAFWLDGIRASRAASLIRARDEFFLKYQNKPVRSASNVIGALKLATEFPDESRLVVVITGDGQHTGRSGAPSAQSVAELVAAVGPGVRAIHETYLCLRPRARARWRDAMIKAGAPRVEGCPWK